MGMSLMGLWKMLAAMGAMENVHILQNGSINHNTQHLQLLLYKGKTYSCKNNNQFNTFLNYLYLLMPCLNLWDQLLILKLQIFVQLPPPFYHWNLLGIGLFLWDNMRLLWLWEAPWALFQTLGNLLGPLPSANLGSPRRTSPRSPSTPDQDLPHLPLLAQLKSLLLNPLLTRYYFICQTYLYFLYPSQSRHSLGDILLQTEPFITDCRKNPSLVLSNSF